MVPCRESQAPLRSLASLFRKRIISKFKMSGKDYEKGLVQRLMFLTHQTHKNGKEGSEKISLCQNVYCTKVGNACTEW